MSRLTPDLRVGMLCGRAPGWLFPMGRGFFTQARLYVICTGRHSFRRQGCPTVHHPHGLVPLTTAVMFTEKRA